MPFACHRERSEGPHSRPRPVCYVREFSSHSLLFTMPKSASLSLVYHPVLALSSCAYLVILRLPCHPERSEGPHSRSRPVCYVREFSPHSFYSPCPSPHPSLLPCHPERSEGPMHFSAVRQFSADIPAPEASWLGADTVHRTRLWRLSAA